MPIPTVLQPYSHAFGDTSLRFAGQLLQEFSADSPTDESDVLALGLAAALACEAQQEGHVCVDLSLAKLISRPPGVAPSPLTVPAIDQWKQALRTSPVVSTSNNDKPLVLDGNRLYLGRYWFYENFIASRLKALAAVSDTTQVSAHLLSESTAETDWQKVAVMVALRRRLTVISGGPGTGKTTTLVNILAALKTADHKLVISMAAPTGKAAGRMQEAVQAAVGTLSPELQPLMPNTAVTLHRLLGVKYGSIYFRHNHQQPLSADVVVMDEASMIDLAMMAKLLDALKPTARLILLGDRDQLASVEAGSVLGDICSMQGRVAAYSPGQAEGLQQAGMSVPVDANATALADSIVALQKSYRFADTSGIGRLANAINRGDKSAVKSVLTAGDYDDVHWLTADVSAELIKPMLVVHWRRVMQSASAAEALAAMNEFRLLTAVREGPRGVLQVNTLAEQLLRRAKLLDIPLDSEHYQGQPLMITRNDSVSGLANGDVGIVWPCDNGSLRFYYESEGAVRSLSTARLPDFSLVFAMTVHKSQGSEFNEVLLIMPDRPSPVVTRELFYTAITRAKQRVSVAVSGQVIDVAVTTTVQRSSGLAERLSSD